MLRGKLAGAVTGLTLLVAGFAVHTYVAVPAVHAQAATRVFELRTYTAHLGRFEAMQARFKDHVIPMFEKHGLQLIGFWTAADPPLAENTLVYVLAHPDRNAAKENWAAFQADPEKARVWAETEKDGPINLKVESMYLEPVDFSPIK
jgi:hypothetical protein